MACYQLHYARVVRALELAGASHVVAEDHAQEAFARMLGRWRRVRRGPSPAGYAYRVAFRLLSHERRAAAPASSPLGAAFATPATAPAPVLARAASGEGGLVNQSTAGSLDDASAVAVRVTAEAALAAMPPRRRACAVLCLVVGASTTEAADILGIAEGTVRKHLAEARADLRAVLAD